jgi:hypothetical protein
MFSHVSDDNFVLYAAQNYENPNARTKEEFLEDLSRIKFVLKMFRRYEKDKILNERLILNHLILLYNVFRHDAMTRMLVLKFRDHLHILKPFLILLNYWPEKITNVGIPGATLMGSDVPMDMEVVNILRKI